MMQTRTAVKQELTTFSVLFFHKSSPIALYCFACCWDMADVSKGVEARGR
jgi:hypothetical protein